jgi:hypothetical protein
MSGPKIVDIRVVEAIEERQRRLMRKRFRQLQKQWQQQRQRIEAAVEAIRSLIDADEIKGIEQTIVAMDRRFAQLNDDQSMQELENRGVERLAFMDAELKRLQQQINDSVIEAQQRARSMRAALTDLAGRLQAAGLEQECQALMMAPSAEALERAAQLLSRREGELQQEQNSQALKQVLDDLGISAASRQLQPEQHEPERERIEQLLVQLELLDNGSDAADLRARLDALDGELDPRQRRLRLDSLALLVSQAIQRRSEAVDRQAILDELEAQLGVYDTVPAELIKAIAAQRESQQNGPSLTDLREVVQRWCEQEARRLDGERIRSVVLGSLRELGYDVREGMATGWVEGGSIVLQRAGSSDYAVELQDMNGRLRTQVVRYGDPSAPVNDQQRQRDTEIEEQWCTAHAQTLANLRQHGMEAQVMAKRSPGEAPLKVVRATEARSSNQSVGLTNQSSQRHRN